MNPIVFPFNQPTRPNFSEFVYYEGFFTASDIERIKSMWDSENEEKATLSGAKEGTDDTLRKTKVTFVKEQPDSIWLYHRLGELGIRCNHERYGYDLLGFHHELQLARYGVGDFFDWHMDFGAGEISHRKLSISVQLSGSEEYEGGDLQFMINQNAVSVPRTKGTVVIFPSFILHRVTPITQGLRQSVVAWLAGPPYR